MTIEFAPATRAAMKCCVALTGPSGAGKTFTGLTLAHHLADREGGRLAVIDTERGKSQMYKGINGWDFDITCPQSFSPASLTETLAVAAGRGYPAVLLDSWSHYWMGVDGMLEQVDRKAANGNKFGGWKEMRPDERRMIDAIVTYPGHIVVTLRVKTEYVVEDNDRGKKAPRKIGLKPEQRDNIEFEFDVIGDMDYDNNLTVSKTRVPILNGAVIHQPAADLADTIADWLADGEEIKGPIAYRDEVLKASSRAELRALLGTVNAAGLANAPVTDADGNPMVLNNLIIARGHTLPEDAPKADEKHLRAAS